MSMKHHTKGMILIDRTKTVGALSVFNFIFPTKKRKMNSPNLAKLAFLLCRRIAEEGGFNATEENYQQFAGYASEKLNEQYTTTSIKSVLYRLNALGFLDRSKGAFTFSDILEKRLEQFIVALRELKSRQNILLTV